MEGICIELSSIGIPEKMAPIATTGSARTLIMPADAYPLGHLIESIASNVDPFPVGNTKIFPVTDCLEFMALFDNATRFGINP